MSCGYWKDGAKSALTISFDDCYKSTCNNTINLLAEYGLSATYNVPIIYVNKQLEGLMVASWEDLKKAADMNMEIASHSYTHDCLRISFKQNIYRLFNSLWHEKNRLAYISHAVKGSLNTNHIRYIDEKSLLREAIDSRSELCLKMQLIDIASYSYPYGAYSPRYKFIIDSLGYLSARSLDRGYNFPKSTDFFALKSIVWNQYMTLEIANKWVDGAVKKGAWLIETYHLVDKKNDSKYPDYISLDDFQKHLDYISSKDMWIDTEKEIAIYLNSKIKDRKHES